MFNKFALIARRGAVPHPHYFSRENRTGRARGTCSAGSQHVVGIGSRTNPRITEYERPEERTIHVWRACHACTGICWWGNPYNGWKWKGIHCIPRNDHWTLAVRGGLLETFKEANQTSCFAFRSKICKKVLL